MTPDTVLRRAPFSDNPAVGPRGQRTQQRILEAALRVLRERGYDRCSVDAIAKQAGCSRVSFYQYFSSKEQVYYALAGQVTRQVRAAVEALDPVQADPAGWNAIRGWVARSGDIFERYGPVFDAFEAVAAQAEAVAERTEAVAALRATTDANVASIRARLSAVRVPPREIDAVLTLLLACIVRTFHHADVLRSHAPAAYPRERIENALTDVVHRTLFGLQPGVNARDLVSAPLPVRAFDSPTRKLLSQVSAERDRAGAGTPTALALLAAGREVFIRRGYHGARVDDIVAAAGLSHGAFYRHFKNKDEFAQVLVLEAIRPLAGALAQIPANTADGAAGTAALRRWLRRYNAQHVHEAAIIRVWVDATTPGAPLGADAAPAVDWGRRHMAGFLRPRGFGDIDVDAVVMVALLDAFGSQPRPATTVDAAAHIIQRGLLGQ
jgi:AcrR family transcriptional regulator